MINDMQDATQKWMPGSDRWDPTLMAATPLGYPGQTCMPKTPETPLRTPSSTIILPPPPPSSVGKRTKLATLQSCHRGYIMGQSSNRRCSLGTRLQIPVLQQLWCCS